MESTARAHRCAHTYTLSLGQVRDDNPFLKTKVFQTTTCKNEKHKKYPNKLHLFSFYVLLHHLKLCKHISFFIIFYAIQLFQCFNVYIAKNVSLAKKNILKTQTHFKVIVSSVCLHGLQGFALVSLQLSMCSKKLLEIFFFFQTMPCLSWKTWKTLTVLGWVSVSRKGWETFGDLLNYILTGSWQKKWDGKKKCCISVTEFWKSKLPK